MELPAYTRSTTPPDAISKVNDARNRPSRRTLMCWHHAWGQRDMKQSPLGMFFDLSRLAIEANMVVGLRMMKLAAGGTSAATEAQLMVSEKMQMATTLAIENTMALATGRSVEAIHKSTVAKYTKAVRANRRRLSHK